MKAGSTGPAQTAFRSKSQSPTLSHAARLQAPCKQLANLLSGNTACFDSQCPWSQKTLDLL